MRRVAFTIATGNTDMHLKNWSLIYRDARTPAFAPVYDYLCMSVYAISGRNELALSLDGVNAFAVVDDDVFDRFARRADVPPRIVLSAAHEMRDRILTKWSETRELIRAGLLFLVERIDDLLSTVPIFWASNQSQSSRKAIDL